jgi:hypothetical protein
MKLLTPAHVAAVLHIKPQSLRVKRMRGDGPPFIRLSDSLTARVYYPEAEFLAWLAARLRRISTAEEKRREERLADELSFLLRRWSSCCQGMSGVIFERGLRIKRLGVRPPGINVSWWSRGSIGEACARARLKPRLPLWRAAS